MGEKPYVDGVGELRVVDAGPVAYQDEAAVELLVAQAGDELLGPKEPLIALGCDKG